MVSGKIGRWPDMFHNVMHHSGQGISEDEYIGLVVTHFDDVWAFVRRRCFTREDADDLTSETFTVAWRRRADLPRGQERLWLFGVARLVLCNHRRSVRRQELLQARLATTSPRPEQAGEDEDAGLLQPALEALPAGDREALIMRVWDQLSVTEMATLLGCTPNAVSMRLHKARRRLTAAMEELVQKDDSTSGHVSGPGKREEDRDVQRK